MASNNPLDISYTDPTQSVATAPLAVANNGDLQ